MNRAFHRWPALLALLLVTVLTLTGAALSIFPAAESLTAPQIASGQTVAALAERVQAAFPGLEQIRRAPSGLITAFWFDQGVPGASVIDPATGLGIASAGPSPLLGWLTNLHRSLFLGDGGRIVMAGGAAAMLILSISGTMLVARRAGGWKYWFAPLRGPLAGRLHVEIARVAVLGLILSSVTALWMTASTFNLLPDGPAAPVAAVTASGQTGASLLMMPTLKDTLVTDLRELSFPYPGDATDVFTLKTDRGTGYIDQGTGALLSWTDLTGWKRVSETIYMLHTGRGASALGLLLGVMGLGVPVMGVTGVLIWRAGRRGQPRIHGNKAAGHAETILLVGSEGGSTWSFAATLHAALTQGGQSVHIAPMSAFAPDRYACAKQIIILAATYGDGDAPASAKGFLDRLAALDRAPTAALAVLGFGDRSFPAYCAFAKAVSDAARAKGWQELMPMDSIDRQSTQTFARWGRALGQVMKMDLDLAHQPVLPRTQTLTLLSRRDYGVEVQAPTTILRFALPTPTVWQRLTRTGFAHFNAGDLISILPKGSPVPRLYSLASSRRDGFVEIVVKQHPGGLCSGQLTSLVAGDTVAAVLRRNPEFQPGRGRAPLILIGAGTGIGPLAGFMRANTRRRPIHLFFGMRHPDSDFLYAEEIRGWQDSGHLAQLATAVSRMATPNYVQDVLRGEAAEVARLIRDGARVMVCGGRDMATGVVDALTEILAPTGKTLAVLKAEGRYVEDVY